MISWIWHNCSEEVDISYDVSNESITIIDFAKGNFNPLTQWIIEIIYSSSKNSCTMHILDF